MSDADLKEVFMTYANFGAGTERKNTELESRNLKKMTEEAKIFKKKGLTPAELDMIYTRCKGPSKKIPLANFQTMVIPQLAKAVYGSDSEDNQTKIKADLIKATPSLNTNLKESKDNVVGRLTDTKGYTGAHKERFDESGKGKGLDGRTDKTNTSGYVQGYKNEGTKK